MSAKGSAFEAALREVLDKSGKEHDLRQHFGITTSLHERVISAKSDFEEAGSMLFSTATEGLARVVSVQSSKKIKKRKKKSKETLASTFKAKAARIKERFVRAARYAKEHPGSIHPEMKVRLWGL